MEQFVAQLASFVEQDEVFVEQEIEQLLIYTVLLAVALAMCCLVAEGEGPVARFEMGQIILWVPLNWLLLGAAFACVYELHGTAETRWFGNCEAGKVFMRLYIGTQIAASVADIGSGILCGNLKSKVPILAHHIGSIIGYGGGIFFNRMHFYACFDGICEVTTVFLNILLLSKSNTRTAGWLTANFAPLLKLNGALLWFTFIVFRLLLFPCWLYLFATDWSHLLSEEQKAKMTWFELVTYPAVTFLLLVLSSMWFASIHKGMMKALVTKDPSKDE